MASYNKVIFMGNLTRDPETKAVGTTQKTRITVASTKKGYTRKDGTPTPDSVCYMDVDLWGPLAKIAMQFLKKASNVQIEGYIEQADWTDTQGNQRTKHIIHAENIVMVGKADTKLPAEDMPAPKVLREPLITPRLSDQINPIDDNDLPF
jgi:single-strand DNA-binding protein